MNLTNKLVQILQDDEVQRLSLLLRRFNPFEVLKIGHYELRHTNTLAWLLDPAGNHGLGDTFLRAFIARLNTPDPTDALTQRFETADDRTVTIRREVRLSHLRRDADKGERLGLVDVDELDHGDTEPHSNGTNAENNRREGAVDILVDGHNWILAIEAKVRAGEGEGQLKTYQEALTAYKDPTKLLVSVFLTIDGDDPSEHGWVSANWEENVIDPLEKVLSIHPDLREDIRSFLTSYLSSLKRYAGDGDEVKRLAATLATREHIERPLQEIQQQITEKAKNNSLDERTLRLLRRHAPTIRLLFAEIAPPQVARARRIESLLYAKGFVRLSGPASYISFVPGGWKDEFKEMIKAHKEKQSIVFEIVNRFSRITIKLMIPSLGESFQDEMANRRRELLRTIHGNQENADIFPHAFYRNRSRSPRPATDRYYSIYIKNIDINNKTNEEDINNWISTELDQIKANMLCRLENMMRNLRFNQLEIF